MHVYVNATYIADLLLSPSTPPRSRMGDLLQSSEVLSKLSAIMAGESTTEGEGWPKGLTGVEVSLRTADVSPREEERLRLSDRNSILMTQNLSGIRSEALIGRRSSYIVLAIVYEWQTKDKRPQRSNVKALNL